MIELSGPPRLRLSPKIIPFFAVHAACIAAFWLPFSWSLVGLAVGLYVLRMWALTAGYHRYFSHRSYKTSRVFQFVIGWLGAMCVQKGPLWWAAHHRQHHRHSDRYGDLHSPGLQGFLWAHVGWVLSTDHDETDYERVGDFARYPELVWLNRFHLVPGVVLAGVLLAVGGLPAFIWGFCISTTVLWHATFSINSLTHLWGRRRYRTKDDSRNSLILALVTLGEGWHNNHHYYKASTRQGFYWWEVDISYYVLRVLSWFRIVWDLKEPSAQVKASNRLDGPEPALRERVLHELRETAARDAAPVTGERAPEMADARSEAA
ncbi:MAG TPA: acyl-CoA desaturase [Thermoanaerobaculia bacterium]|nr:acyl-CoA desaturase [Thermoanaerobaculia bacterium]